MPTRRVGFFGRFDSRSGSGGRGGGDPTIIAVVTPLIPLVAGVLALAAAGIVLRSFGRALRVGRLLGATPRVSVEEALAIAARPEPRYVRVDGRLDAEEEFEDEHHRPLVFRRTRIEAQERGSWRVLEDRRETVPFEVREGTHAIAVDVDALGEGLVVVPRVGSGRAGDVPDRMPSGTAPEMPVRVRIEQVSSVEHAAVLGVPVAAAEGSARLTAGLGRPLVLTTLADGDAMRLLGGGKGVRPVAAAALLIAGLLLIALAAAWAALEALT